MIMINNLYEIGDIVYLKTDEDQSPRMIVHIIVYRVGDIVYKLAQGTVETYHYEFELSKEKSHINI